jgi:2'-5' RNA ligase
MSKRKIPLLELKIDAKKGTFVNAIALVENPAISSNFIAFSKDEPTELKFAVNEERMELLGAAMIPNLPMYRNTKEVGEYMSVFSAETIREIAQTFAEKGFFNNMNVDHSDRSAGSYVFQSYIVDEAKGINAPKGVDVPDGTWMVGVKVNDAKVWEDIKAGKTKGFSVEGIFDLFDTSIDIELSKLAEDFELLLNEYFSEKKGCLMFFPEVDLTQWKLKGIELAPNAIEQELEPHVTILYGFTDFPELIDGLKSFVREALNESPLMIELGLISKFVQPEQDVIKIDIYDCNGTLNAINAILSDTFQIVSPYGDYRPHVTIAYTEPRPDVTFSSERARLWEFGFEYLNKGKIVYSDANGLHTEILTIK